MTLAMEVFGVEFAPLNIPIKRRLQTIASAAWFVTMAFGGFICFLLAIYLVLFSTLWSGVLLYMLWAHFVDKNTCEEGGRRSEWVRSWSWWKYLRDYFPVKIERVPWVTLDAKRNYLFCAFPHGMLSTGPFVAFGTTYGGFNELFPDHKPHMCTLAQHFQMPFFRELALSLGGIMSSEKSINYLLSDPNGGNAVALMVGGAAEAFNCRPGSYKLVLKRRKGFVRLALKNGAPLVPVISFGETDVFSQVANPEGSKLRRLQEWLKKYIGIAPAVPMGRGFFQYNYGIIPYRKPVTTVVGQPIDVKKTDNPTREEVDALHAKFMEELSALFEEQKHRYLENASEVKLEIE